MGRVVGSWILRRRKIHQIRVRCDFGRKGAAHRLLSNWRQSFLLEFVIALKSLGGWLGLDWLEIRPPSLHFDGCQCTYWQERDGSQSPLTHFLDTRPEFRLDGMTVMHSYQEQRILVSGVWFDRNYCARLIKIVAGGDRLNEMEQPKLALSILRDKFRINFTQGLHPSVRMNSNNHARASLT